MGWRILICDYENFERAAHLKYMPILGEISIKEVWRIGATYLYKIFGDEFLNLDIEFVRKIDEKKWEIMKSQIENNINLFLNSSMGRLFDAVSSICGIRDKITYEGQASIELEMKMEKDRKRKHYNYEIKKEKNVYIIDPEIILREIVEDIKKKVGTGIISFKFHITISEIINQICKILRDERNINKVCLSGGVFQNVFLLNETTKLLKKNKFEVFIHNRVPANDGGLSLGQAIIATFLSNI
jgi:hydrogenase maturation protein HypF